MKKNESKKTNKLTKWLKSEKFQNEFKPEITRVLAVIIFTFIYGLGLSWFLQVSPIRLYTGGVPGIAQLFVDFLKYIVKLDSVTSPNFHEGTWLGILIMAFNIPVFILGWFGVSKKFTIYSIISVVIQSTVLSFIHINTFAGIDPTLLAILGGILIGIGAGGALKYGTSTGGFDIIAQYISLKKGRSVGFISTVLNVAIAVLGSIVISHGSDGLDLGTISYTAKELGAQTGVLTIFRILITMLVMDKIHTSYNYVEVNIITDFPEEITEKIMSEIKRGVTLLDVRGGYGYHEKTMIFVVIMSFEKSKLLQLVRSIDPKAFISTVPVSSISGNFTKRTIA